MTDAATFTTNLFRVSPAGQRLAEAFRLFAHGSRRYLAVATVFGAVVALLDVVALTILDIRYAWLWGCSPSSPTTSPTSDLDRASPPTVIALLDQNGVDCVAVVVIYCVINLILQSVIQPRVVGNTVAFPAPRFLSLIVWSSILGGVGALLAVPASLFVKALFVDVDPERGWVNSLLSNSADEEKPIRTAS